MDSRLRAGRGPTRRNGHSYSDECRSISPSQPPHTAGGAMAGRKKTGRPLWKQKCQYVSLMMALFVVTTPWFHKVARRHRYRYQPIDLRQGVHPRVVRYLIENSRLQVLDPSAISRSRNRELSFPLSGKETLRSEDNGGRADPFETEECRAQHPWQLEVFPSCNTLHELGIANRKNFQSVGERPNRLSHLANGYWRDVWLIQELDPGHQPEDYRNVLKTQRYQHDFDERNFDRNRRDALTAERLTTSPYIADIFGFCGSSSLSEHADGGDIRNAIWSSSHTLTKREELVLATQAAMGLAALHNFDKEGWASIAHTDITPGQFIKVGNRYKLSDFNRARFLRWNVEKNGPCGYTVGRNPGKNRSPEEYQYKVQSEKVDVYSLGNIFYMLLQKESPFSDVREKEAKRLVKEGFRPSFDATVWNSTHPVDQALKEAMVMCHEQEPEQRATARQVEAYLKDRLASLYPNITEF